MERIYKPLEDYTDKEIRKMLENNNVDELRTLPFSIGMNHSNWKFAQDICVILSKHEDSIVSSNSLMHLKQLDLRNSIQDSIVSSNSLMGLAYIARTKGKLEKHIVKPVLLRGLKGDKEFEWRAKDAIGNTIFFMIWKIGKKPLK